MKNCCLHCTQRYCCTLEVTDEHCPLRPTVTVNRYGENALSFNFDSSTIWSMGHYFRVDLTAIAKGTAQYPVDKSTTRMLTALLLVEEIQRDPVILTRKGIIVIPKRGMDSGLVIDKIKPVLVEVYQIVDFDLAPGLTYAIEQ